LKNKIVVFFVIVALIAMIIIPLAGCTNGDDTKTTTTNPIVALQEDVDELNDNFNTEVANIKSRLSTLETSSIPANITNRVATLEANVAALQVTVNALSAGDSVDLTALTEAVNNIADDVLAAHSSIDAIRGDVNDINLDITDLKNKYNSITIPDYDSRIQEVELRIVSILSSVQTYGDDITDIKDDIVDIIDYIVYMTDYIVLNTHNISTLDNKLDNELNNVKSRLSAVENRLSALAADCDDRLSEVELRIVGILDDLQGYETEIAELQSVVSDIQDDIDILFANDAALQEQIDVLQGQVNNIEIISFNEVADYLTFRTNVAGSYAVVITYYGTGFDGTSTVSIPTADNVTVISATYYGASGTMLKVILEPAQVLAGNPPVLVDTNWVAGKLVGVTRIGAGDVQYATIEIAVR
jgi:predicted  nucleic acid-binding Zn-ribbon protein